MSELSDKMEKIVNQVHRGPALAISYEWPHSESVCFDDRPLEVFSGAWDLVSDCADDAVEKAMGSPGLPDWRLTGRGET